MPEEGNILPAKQESRNPDGTFPKGVSGNPAGPPTGHVKLAHWLRVYIAEGEEGLARAPEKAQEFIRAHFGPDAESADRGRVWDRHDGALIQQHEDVTDYREHPRRILLVQTTEMPPTLPEEVRELEDARAAAEQQMQRAEPSDD